VSNEAFQTPESAPRRKPQPAPASQPGRRRPLKRAWEVTRERMGHAHIPTPKLKTPSKPLTWVAGVLALLAIAIAILVAIWDWNWFRGPVERYASARLNRPVDIAGDLHVDIFSWQPTASVERVTIGNARWAGAEPMGRFEKITARIRLIPLLWGDVDLRLLRFDRPDLDLYADAQGRRNWEFSDQPRKEPMRLPPIRNFVVRDGKLEFRDVRKKLTFQATLQAHEKLGAANRGFEMTGRGTINSQPFRMEVTGGPLVNIDRNRAYPFDADIHAGQTHVTARGQISRPFDLGRFHMAATARGPDMSDLYPLTGVALPNTPPYNLRGRLSREGLLWKIDGLNGRVGDSDLAGDLSVDTGRDRPLLKANLRSRSLDFDDLGAVFGGSPSVGPGETASPEQRAMNARLGAQDRIFPDATLDFTRIRAMDADVTYRAVSIRDAPVNLRGGSVRVRLDDALLRADPLRLELPRGLVQGHVNLNARKQVPVTALDLRLTNARIEDIIPVRFGGAPPLTGAVVGRAKLTGEGNSIHKAFANADGEVVVVAPGGEIRKAFAELMGVNVVKGLGLLLKKDMETTPIRCGVAHFQTKDGVMTADRIVFDTKPVLVTGSGVVNLDTERMAFKVRGHNKKFRLVRVLLPVKAEGPIRAPKLGVEPGAAIAQGGVAVGLGALLNPLAAILPFVDPGLAKDANCGALLAEARAEGAPLSTAAR
jgi:AsmA family protein